MKITALNKKQITEHSLSIFIRIVQQKYKPDKYKNPKELAELISKEFNCNCTEQQVIDYTRTPEEEEARIYHRTLGYHVDRDEINRINKESMQRA